MNKSKLLSTTVSLFFVVLALTACSTKSSAGDYSADQSITDTSQDTSTDMSTDTSTDTSTDASQDNTNAEPQTSATSFKGPVSSDGLVLSYDEATVGAGAPCSSAFCDFFSVNLSNVGNTPVDLFDDICLIAGGKTYSENFGHTVSGTLNPGENYGFDAVFRPADGAHVTQMYLGDCSEGTKDVALPLSYKAAD